MRKKKTKREGGFTLIELLVVVAILGIIAALLLPVFQGALQKTKQKATMTDMVNLAKAVASYITDFGSAPPSPDGDLDAGDQFVTGITPFQVVTFSTRDQWGFPFQVWTGQNVGGKFNIPQADVGPEDFLIQSMGRDGEDEGFVFDPTNPETSYYFIRSPDDFKKDLILWNGNWILAPRHTGS